MLRLAMTGRLGEAGLGDEGVYDVLDLCLECRACKAECPVGVDVARFKSEFLADYWADTAHRSMRASSAGAHELAKWGSRRRAARELRIEPSAPVKALNESIFGIDRRRSLPQWSARTLTQIAAARSTAQRRRPSFQRHVYELLQSRDRRGGDGRASKPAASTSGCAERVLRPPAHLQRLLRQSHATRRRERGQTLRPGAKRERSSSSASQAASLPCEKMRRHSSEATSSEKPRRSHGTACPSKNSSSPKSRPAAFNWASPKLQGPILLHGHCHQKSMGLLPSAKALYGRIPEANVIDPDAGCCGMAGSFGYSHDHFEVSRQIGERRLLPAVRNSRSGHIGRRFRILLPPSDQRLHRRQGDASGRLPPVPARRARMSLAAISVAALFVTIVVSCVTQLNVGVLAIAMAWIIGVYLGGFKVDQIAAGFPAQLFLTLVGMTLLFAQAQGNGTLDKLAHKAVRGCRGNTGLIPVMFFFVAAGLASMGPGNIASAALIAPIAMAVAGRAGIPAFLMAIMVGNGANAGSLSPFAPTGIIVTGLMAKIGMPGLQWQTYLTNLAAHAGVAFAGYALFGGLKLFARRSSAVSEAPQKDHEALDRDNWITLVTIFCLLTSVIFFNINVGMGAFLAAGFLGLVRAADHAKPSARSHGTSSSWSVA